MYFPQLETALATKLRIFAKCSNSRIEISSANVRITGGSDFNLYGLRVDQFLLYL